MSTVVHAANAVINNGWSNAGNAFSTTTDGVFATAAPARNGTIQGDFSFPDFTSGEIPDGSLINSATLTVNWGMTAAVAGGTLGAQLRNNGTALGTETTQTATTQQNATQVLLSGVSLTDLRSASTLLLARVRCAKGNTNSAMTGNLDFVSLTVNWSPPPPTNKVVGAMGKAKKVARALSRSKGGIIAIGLAMLPNTGRVNRPINFGFSSTGTIGTPAAHRTAKITQIKKKPPRGHRGGQIAIGLITPSPQAPGSANGTLNKPINFGILARGQADFLAFGAGVHQFQRPFVKPRRGRVISKHAPLQRGPIGILNQAINFGHTITGSVENDGSLNKPINFSILARGSVNVDGTLNQAINFGRSIAGSVQVDGSLNQPINFGIVAAGTSQSSRTGTLNRAINFGRSIHGSVQVDGSLNQPIVFGILARASVAVLGTLNQPLVFGHTIRGIGPLATVVPGPTIIDALARQSSLTILSVPSGVNLLALPSSLNVLALPSFVNILSSESSDMSSPNIVHFIKQGDTSPPLSATLGSLITNADGSQSISPDNLSGCTVTVNIGFKKGNAITLIVTDGACTVTDAVNGVAQYNFLVADTATPGDAIAEFKSIDGSGKIKRYPDALNFTVKITPQVGP